MPPWEKYKKPEEAPAGPWAKYGGVTTTADPEKSALGEAVSFMSNEVGPPTVDEGGFLKRLAKATRQQFLPTSIDEVKDLVSPSAGRYGVSRLLEQEGKKVGRAVKDSTEVLTRTKFGAENPNLAASLSVIPATLAEVLGESLTPSAMQQNLGAEFVGPAAKMVASKALSKASPVIRATGERAINSMLGPSKEAVKARFESPEAIKSMENKEWLDIANDAAAGLKAVREKIGEEAGKAWKTLADKPTIPKEELVEGLKRVVRDLKVGGDEAVGPAQEKAVGIIAKIKDRILGVGKNADDVVKEVVDWDTSGLVPEKRVKQVIEKANPLEGKISEKEMKQVIMQLDENINWDDPNMKPLNDALQSLRTTWDNGLKTRNKSYEKAMRPTAALTRTFEETKNLLGFDRDLNPRNTEGILKNLSGKTRGHMRKMLSKFKAASGVDVPESSNRLRLANEFRGGVTQGSRRTTPYTVIGSQIGSTIGGVVAGWPGAGVGGVIGGGAGYGLGSYVDAAGRESAGTLIDSLVRMSRNRAAKPPSGYTPGIRALLALAARKKADQ